MEFSQIWRGLANSPIDTRNATILLRLMGYERGNDPPQSKHKLNKCSNYSHLKFGTIFYRIF